MDEKSIIPIVGLAIFLFIIYPTIEQTLYGNQKSTTTTMKSSGRTAILETDKGIIKILLFDEDMPVTTKNFESLVESGFYSNLTFHRVEPGFVIQTGDPTGTGNGGSGKTIPLEISPKHNNIRGGVGMARSSDPNSASSQFYILMRDSPHLDGGYAVFGEVTEGIDIVEKIQVGDKLLRATLE